MNKPLPPSDRMVDTLLYYLRNRHPGDDPFYAQVGFFETQRPFVLGEVVWELCGKLSGWMQTIGDPMLTGPGPDPWHRDAIRELKFKSHPL